MTPAGNENFQGKLFVREVTNGGDA
jgi:hypothetical protein